ncbi:hypothetical protein [Clostridium sp. YIM B02555]|uniref:hypothetical protein n=1 Tax=Clostridium sp. YIM B02555 TaxID=2911968 RepID=UPI001EEE49B2|nr:hypothetical protein [Clostridium sp. YIM B02555]
MKEMVNIGNRERACNILLYLEFKASVGDFYIFKCSKRYYKKSNKIEKCNFYVVYSLKRKDILFKFHVENMVDIFEFLTDNDKIKFLEEVLLFGGIVLQDIAVEKIQTGSYSLHIANKQDIYNRELVFSKYNAEVNLIDPKHLCC